MSNEMFNNAKIILATWGEFEVYNMTRLIKIYRDNKVTVIGLFDRENHLFERIFITLNFQEEGPPNQQQLFQLPVEDMKNQTVVYSAYRLSETEYIAEQFMRPGRWEQYVEQLLAKAKEIDKKLAELNHTQINDSKLFPDLDLLQ
ncbi:MAG: hypothetical protein ABI690_31390 [Chloroflexota bacterium]